MSCRETLWQAMTGLAQAMPRRIRLAFLENPLIVPLDYQDLQIIAHGSTEYYVRAKSAAKEPDLIEWLKRIPSTGVFVDIGANVGTYSLIAAHMHPQLTILAIEPSAPNYASLCQNIHLNQMGHSIMPICVPLGSTMHMGGFHYSNWEPGAALHENNPTWDVEQQQALFYTLDDLVRILDFPRPTHVKIDVDGAEMDVLSGAVDTLDKATSIFIEVGNTAKDIQPLRFLKDRGYRIQSRRQCQPRGEYSQYWNVQLTKGKS